MMLFFAGFLTAIVLIGIVLYVLNALAGDDGGVEIAMKRFNADSSSETSTGYGASTYSIAA